MHVLYHHRTQGRGAEGLHVAKVVEAFQRLGHRVTIVSPPGIKPDAEHTRAPLDKAYEQTKGIRTLWKIVSKRAPQVLFEILEIVYNLYAIGAIRNVASHGDIDFIYERSAYFLFAGAMMSKFFDIPLIVEANEVVGIKRARPLVLKGLARKLEAYTFKRASVIFTVSSYLKDKIRDILQSESKMMCVTPNAIDPEEFRRPTKRDVIRRKYNLANRTVLGFAGWFDWWDRLDLLVSAIKELVDGGHQNVCAMIVGDGYRIAEVKALAVNLGIKDRVIFTGPIERNEIIDYLDAIDVGVIAHSNEFGSPVVLFEMMALGKIIVAPRLRPITDVIKNRMNGMLFEPLDLSSLTETLENVLLNFEESKEIGRRAREIALSKFTWHNNAKRILAVLSQ